ncbi:MAG TPA: AMP-binding protein, partial [Longimicrobiaceae bacterium]
MTQSDRFDAVLVGEGALLVRCGESLLLRGHRVRGVASPGGVAAEWAARHGIAHAAPGADLGAFLRSTPCDYLFSIVNRRVLPREVFALAARAAINLHDSPLPRYAGVHATSWALLGREEVHGVTWHLVAEAVDAGDVLKQRLVEVEPRDTALTLNARCYDAAAESFEELVDELAAGRALPRPQDLARRSYFPLHARPEAACSVDWGRPAEEIDALVRALDFGGYVNPLGLPKAWIAGEPVPATRAEPTGRASLAEPGTVVAVDDEWITVATGTSDLRVGGFRAPDGGALPTAELARVGDRLPSLDPAEAGALSAEYGRLCRHEPFWVGRLHGAEPLTLGTPSARGGAGASVETPLGPEVRARLASLEEAERLPWLTAACGAFLARVTGARRFNLGLARGGGPLSPVFAGTVPLRFEVEPERPFTAVLEAVRAELWELERRGTFARDLPLRYPELRRLAGELPGGRWPVSVAWPGAAGDAEAGALRLELSAGPAACRWAHDPEAVAAEEVEALAAQLGAFLAGVVEDPARPLAALPRVSPEERRRLLEWSGTEAERADAGSIQELFSEQAARTPDAVAVESEGERITYAELEHRANRLARALRRIGVGPERLVGIALDGSVDAIVAMLGVLKARSAYLPLDPAYPRERLEYMLEDSGAVALLTRTEHLGALPQAAVPILCLDRDRDVVERESAEPPEGDEAADELAYLIYTSGSTGRPKGVMVPHRGVVNLARSFRETLELGPGDRLLLLVSLSFDASVGTIWATLAAGGTLVLPRERAALGGEELRRFCDAHRITAVDMPAALWQHWLGALEGSGDRDLLPALRLVLAGGESVRVEQLRSWAELTGGRVVFVGPYGPTETT